MTEYGCILTTCDIGGCDDPGNVSGIQIDGIPSVIKLFLMAK